jgi:hypothetical protein
VIHPIVLGTGARLFDGGTTERDLRLVNSRTLSTGVISATYARA